MLLALLSDVHIWNRNARWVPRDFASKRLTGWVHTRWMGRGNAFRHAELVMAAMRRDWNSLGVNHIVFAGDATTLGFEEEMRHAAKCLEVGTMPGMAVPGNHDLYTLASAARGWFDQCFEPWQRGERIGLSRYPFVQDFDSVSLVGLNSSRPNRLPWDARGLVDRGQLDRFNQLMQSDESRDRILVTHYPATAGAGKRERYWHALANAQELVASAARARIRLWVHGHCHRPSFSPANGTVPFPVLCLGSATQDRIGSYCTISVEDRKWEICRRSYDFERGMFGDCDRQSIKL